MEKELPGRGMENLSPSQTGGGAGAAERSLPPHHHHPMKALLLLAVGARPRAEGPELDQMVQAELTQ